MNTLKINLGDVSISKSKRKKSNPRSAFLSALMKNLSGDQGEALVSAFHGEDVSKFKNGMSGLIDRLAEAMPNKEGGDNETKGSEE